jgi:hypothetical protein
LVLVVLALAAGMAQLAVAAQGAQAKPAAATSGTKLTGEVVDTGCYLGHEARGEKHKACATKCIASGMPMGLLTAQGELYLITMSHENADPYNQLKGMAAQTVEISGPVSSRAGMKAIQADAVKLLAAAAK